ncbi:hypothetical protein MUN82_02515 [Hymenobacter aerilatus]|uniref:Secretin/TonB short N-terminal domain-containing protein n=1 Tax=Hymenobacter aerilatus TaxID=2932251 RepID=A0A8T9SVS9_9BACT|nr:hypothetical protein [Hymenobacter aerilatus]UOR05985.1 hypothetical protein MUN82_02515 [Hymenobacter aerilatus]
MSTSFLRFLLAASVATVTSLPGIAQTTPTPLHIAAGPLDKALLALSSQTGHPVQFDQRLTTSFRSPNVQGTLLPAQALIQLVQGTGLEAHNEHNTLSVSRVDQSAIELQAATLQAQLGQAVKSQKVTQRTANKLYAELADVRSSVVELAKMQGFVSAAEKASYQRTFAKVQHVLASAK